MSDDKASQATEPKTLRDRIMDCRIAKSEAEHWAAREIEKLESQLSQVQEKLKQFEGPDGLGILRHALGVDERTAQIEAERDALKVEVRRFEGEWQEVTKEVQKITKDRDSWADMYEDLLKRTKDLAKEVQRYVTEFANAQRVIDWMNDPERKPANLAFTEGPERQIAYAFEGMFGKTGFCTQCEQYAKEVQRLRECLRWTRQTIHQAHHDGPIEGCRKNTCDAVTQALSSNEKA